MGSDDDGEVQRWHNGGPTPRRNYLSAAGSLLTFDGQ